MRSLHSGGRPNVNCRPSTPGRALFGNPVFVDVANDVAILEFPREVGPPVTFANSSKVEVGNGAFVVGYPMGIAEQVLISAHIASVSPTFLRLDASVNHGNSGGPLFNRIGEQIGVVNAKHGSLSVFLAQLRNYQPGASMAIGGVDPVQAIQVLIGEMEKNLNLGIGYAIPSHRIRTLHAALAGAIPK